MPKVIISDTSCFIILSKIDEMNLLENVYGRVVTTVEISEEFGEPLPHWIEVIQVKDKIRQRLLEMQIDKGESSAIALALETPDSTIILDDYKARKVANQLGLIFTGTLGVIIHAKLLGKIESIIPLLEKIKETDFRISPELEKEALKEAGEL